MVLFMYVGLSVAFACCMALNVSLYSSLTHSFDCFSARIYFPILCVLVCIDNHSSLKIAFSKACAMTTYTFLLFIYFHF